MSGIELKGLKGLDILLNEAKQSSSAIGNVIAIPIHDLLPGKYQPRTEFDDKSLHELANSIKESGIIQPIIVRKLNSEQYEIIAGERRWRSAGIVGLTEVPVIIRNIPDDTALAFALIENIQRENLNPIEQAMALSRLSDEFLMTHEKIAKIVGVSRSAVTNLIRLLSLTSEVKNLLKQRRLEVGHAKVLMTLDNDKQQFFAKKIIEDNLSVRATENLVKKNKQTRSNVHFKNNRSLEANELVKILTQKLSMTVNVNLNRRGGGKLEIKFDSMKEAIWLVENLEIISKKA